MPASPYGVSKLAQEMLGGRRRNGRAGASRSRGRSTTSARARIRTFAASGFARRIADIEAGRWAPEISVGNLDARRDLTDVRDTVRAYQLILERGQPGAPVQRLLGPRDRDPATCSTCCSRARACRSRSKVDPARYRPNDMPLLLGDPSRLRDELGWTPRFRSSRRSTICSSTGAAARRR